MINFKLTILYYFSGYNNIEDLAGIFMEMIKILKEAKFTEWEKETGKQDAIRLEGDRQRHSQ